MDFPPPAALHVHSAFSPLWGVPTPEALLERVVALGYRAVSVTDRNGLYGLHFLLEAFRHSPVQLVVGAELSKDEDRALCWVESDLGYRNLCRLLSELHCDPGFSLPDRLGALRDGLAVASDGPRVLGRLARDGHDGLYVEVSPGHGMHLALAEARRRGLPPVATVRAVGLGREDWRIHRVLRAIACSSTIYRLEEGDTARPGDFLVSPQRLAEFFPHCPDALENTLRIAARCTWSGPSAELVFPSYHGLSAEQAYRELARRAHDGVLRRYGELQPVVAARLEKELRLIRDKGFSAYFLVVDEIVKLCPRTCGRGSAAASLVAYALGITHVDPIRHNLFFERFLNAGRIDPPDIDVDFPWDERDAVLDAVFQRYGPRRVAMVANQVGFRWRGAVREVARSYGLPDAEISRVEKDMSHDMDLSPYDMSTGKTKIEDLEQAAPWPEILETASRLSVHLRHLSVHCGGIVVAPDDVRHHAPVQVAAKGVPVIQWEKDQAEAAGLVKIDLLGNRSLAVIRDTLRILERSGKEVIDYASWDPCADPETLQLIRRGETMGCFYVESPATRLLLRRMWGAGDNGKDVFEHLVMASSIIRPAANRFVREFVGRMRGAPWETLHPLLAPVLDETYGVAIYQEQITQVAMALAGFTVEEGDELRKVLSKKHRAKRLADLAERFAAGARNRGVPGRVVDAVWSQVLSFSGYSFCKPHSASYALVSMKCAYLKAHHPAEFLGAVLSNGGGYYVPFAYVSEARRLGIRVLPPCVNRGGSEHRGEGRTLRVGLAALVGVSREGVERLLRARERDGAFRSLGDLLRRTGIGADDARLLVRSGACDVFGEAGSRYQMHYDVDVFFASKKGRNTNRQLFEDPDLSRYVPQPPGVVELRRMEWEALGFPVTFHPLGPWLERARRAARRGSPLVAGRDLERHTGRRVRTLGWWITGKVVQTGEGEPMEFVSFEDTTSIYEATLFPDVYRAVRRRLSPVRPYLLEGVVEEEFGVATLTVERVEFLDRG